MATTDIQRFGALLKHYRRAAGLTQEALAGQARLSVRGIQDLERGASRAPRRDTITLLASALGLSAHERAELVAAGRPGPVAPVAANDLVPLIGRDVEVALLERFLSSATDPPVLLLTGEPGIGKTRLLQVTAARAIARGWTVLAGGCQRRGGQTPYAPLLDALARHLHAARPERLHGALAGCAWLARLLPELAPVLEPPPAGTLPPDQERRLMFAAVARLLSNVAGPAGTLLALDDLQWAGPDALDLLSALVHTPLEYGEVGAGAGLYGNGGGSGAGRGPLRVVGAYRDTEVGTADPLGLLAADLAQAQLIRQRALGPLGREKAAVLLDNLLGSAGAGRGMAEGVLERAAGVPFYLVSYAQALRAAPAPTAGASEAGVATEAIPWDVAQGVRQRVALLPMAAREALGAAAVAGRRARVALLTAALGQPEGAVLDGLEAARRARLLVEDGDDAYTFAHDLIREVVEVDLGAARRATLHRRMAEALDRDREAGGDEDRAGPEVLAYHHAAGGDAEAAARAAEAAGDRAWNQRALAAAEGSYGEALGRLDSLGPAGTRDALRVREKLGEMCYQAGRYAEAAGAWGPVVEAYRVVGDQEGLGRVAARMAWAHARGGAPDAGLALIASLPPWLVRDAHAWTGETPSLDVTAAAHTGMAAILLVAGRYDEALSASERASALARAGRDERERARADGLRLDLLDLVGRLGDALALGHEALPLAEAADDPDVLLRLHRNLAHVHARRGDLAASRRRLARALEVAARLGDSAQRAYTLALGAWVAVVAGDWAAAAAALDEAAALLPADERSWYAPYIPGYRALLALATGDRVGAAAALATAEATLADSSNLQARRVAAAVAAELDLLAGRPGTAVARLAPLLDRSGLEESDVTELLPILAWARLEQGHAAEADATVRRARARARREGMRPVLVEALRVGALVALQRGDDAAAARAITEGLALARSLPYPYAEARLLDVEASLRARRGEDAAAQRDAEAARAIRTRLNATFAAARPAPLSATAVGPAPAPAEPANRASRGRNARFSPAERQAWVVARLRGGEVLSPRAYVAALGLERRTAIRDLRELEERGVIVARGTTTDRRYLLRHVGDER